MVRSGTHLGRQGPMSEPIRFTLNGTERTLSCDPSSALLYALREQCGLTGAHFGCGLNQCGACYVLVEGQPLAACDTPMWSVAGKSVVTVEGLGSPEHPHALQSAIIEEQAMQCGYCISGVLISAAALLDKNPNPQESEVRAALDGNLCRCGAHNRIVRAVMKAARTMAEART